MVVGPTRNDPHGPAMATAHRPPWHRLTLRPHHPRPHSNSVNLCPPPRHAVLTVFHRVVPCCCSSSSTAPCLIVLHHRTSTDQLHRPSSAFRRYLAMAKIRAAAAAMDSVGAKWIRSGPSPPFLSHCLGSKRARSRGHEYSLEEMAVPTHTTTAIGDGDARRSGLGFFLKRVDEGGLGLGFLFAVS
jgi:hypothetical protein